MRDAGAVRTKAVYLAIGLNKVIKPRASFPTDEAVSKLFYLALNNISKKWTMSIRDWKAALNRISFQFEDRLRAD